MAVKKSNSKVSKKSKEEVKFYVEGMHCASCETLITKELKELEGVNSVEVDIKSKEVSLQVDSSQSEPDINKLNKKFNELGYTFHKDKNFYQKDDKNRLQLKDYFIPIIFAGLFVIGFLYLENKNRGIIGSGLYSNSSIFAYFTFGLIAGFSGCAALVGGLLLALSKKWNDIYSDDDENRKMPFMLFITGRLVSFAILGGLLGLVGSYLKISPIATSIMIFVVSIIMLILGLQMLGVSWAEKLTIRTPKKLSGFITDEKNFAGKYMPFIVGSLTFFIPCGFTLVAQSSSLLTGSFIISSYNMLAFALGTLPMLILLSFFSVKLYANPKLSMKFNIFAGIIVIFIALYSIYSQIGLYGIVAGSLYQGNVKGSNVNQGVENLENQTEQVLRITADGFDYYPKVSNLKAGVPVRWEIDNQGADGCASVVYAYGFYPDAIFLKPGLNVVNVQAPKPGVYKISCSMGMVDPIVVNVL